MVVCPAAKIVPAGTPLALNPAPEMLTLVMSMLVVPELVSVACSVLLLPTFTLLKLKLFRFEVSAPGWPLL